MSTGCEFYGDALVELARGGLEPERVQRVEAHLAECEACRADLAVILAIPWLFGIDQGAVETLPLTVQRIVFEEPPPILLKCSDSPHIYLLDQGEKRWIEDIETFNDRGYVWRDVQFIPCDDLGSLPDGVPIPGNAGPPPQP